MKIMYWIHDSSSTTCYRMPNRAQGSHPRHPRVRLSLAPPRSIVGWGEEAVFRRAIIEPLVLAILIGMVVRTVRGDRPREDPGVRFVAKDVLEFAVCLLGATMDVPRLFASGPMLAVGIVLLVCLGARQRLQHRTRRRAVAQTRDARRVRKRDLRQFGDRRGRAGDRAPSGRTWPRRSR